MTSPKWANQTCMTLSRREHHQLWNSLTQDVRGTEGCLKQNPPWSPKEYEVVMATDLVCSASTQGKQEEAEGLSRLKGN